MATCFWHMYSWPKIKEKQTEIIWFVCLMSHLMEGNAVVPRQQTIASAPKTAWRVKSSSRQSPSIICHQNKDQNDISTHIQNGKNWGPDWQWIKESVPRYQKVEFMVTVKCSHGLVYVSRGQTFLEVKNQWKKLNVIHIMKGTETPQTFFWWFKDCRVHYKLKFVDGVLEWYRSRHESFWGMLTDTFISQDQLLRL